METSILNDIKDMLGVVNNDTSFDNELISHINAAISTLTDISIGPKEGYMISDASNAWTELSNSIEIMNAAKQYIFSYVKLIWDPPSNSFVCDKLEKVKDEQFWRLYIKADGVEDK